MNYLLILKCFRQDQDSTGRVMLKQMQQNKSTENSPRVVTNKSSKKNANNTSIDLTDDIEDGASQSFKGKNVSPQSQPQPPALVAFRGNSQANGSGNKPTTTYYVKPNSTVIPSSRLPLRNGKSG